jgi:hypothetical protein
MGSAAIAATKTHDFLLQLLARLAFGFELALRVGATGSLL